MSMNERIKYFFNSKSGKVFSWLMVWLLVYFVLKGTLNKYASLQNYTSSFALIGAAIALFLLVYWFSEKRSTEMPLYTILLIEFLVLRLDDPQVFEKVFHLPFSYLKYIIVVYTALRLTILEKIISIARILFHAYREVQYERAKERKEQRSTLQKERAEQIKRRKEKNAINRQHRIDYWKHIGNTIHEVTNGIKNSFTAIFEGLSKTEKTDNSPQPEKESEKGNESKITREPDSIIVHFSIYYLMIPVLICVTLFVVSILFARSETLEVIFRNTSGTGETVKRIIEVIMSVTVLIIIILILSAVIYNVCIQILMFIIQIRNDLKKAANHEKHTITNNVLYVMTFGIIIFWVKKYYPFGVENFAEDLSNGQLVIYPLSFVFVAIIISFFTNHITTEDIKNYLTNQNTKEIWKDIFSLATDSIKAVVKYLKLVTGDFLSSVRELAEEDNLIDDLEDDENGRE